MAAPARRLFFIACAIAAVSAPRLISAPREPITAPVRLAFGPAADFENHDVSLINQASSRIDMAAYVLTNHKIIAALSDAAARGVQVRLYLDAEQFSRNAGADDLMALTHQPNVTARIKSAQGDLMHLKTYQVDGRYLRMGSANFSYSGENRQDNDVAIIDNAAAAAEFARVFEKLWTRADNRPVSP